MSDVTIRDATGTDVGGVRAVATGAWPETYAGLLSPLTIERALEEWYAPEVVEERVAENLVRVAEEGDTIVGFADVSRQESAAGGGSEATEDAVGEPPELVALYVPPSHHRQGIGTALLDDVEATLREDGAGALLTRVLADNDRALAFYRDRGFERRREETTELFDEEVSEVVLELPL